MARFMSEYLLNEEEPDDESEDDHVTDEDHDFLTHNELQDVLVRFAKPRLDRIVQNNFPTRQELETEQGINRAGFDIVMQLAYCVHQDVLDEVGAKVDRRRHRHILQRSKPPMKNFKVLAVETQEMNKVKRDDDNIVIPDTLAIVPDKKLPTLSIPTPKSDFFNSFEEDDPRNVSEKMSDDVDSTIREKYPKINDILHTSDGDHRPVKREGVLGHGRNVKEDGEESSPSLLRTSMRRSDSELDFKEESFNVPKKRKSSGENQESSGKGKKGRVNSMGVSQQNANLCLQSKTAAMKQSRIEEMFKRPTTPRHSQKRLKNEEEELELATRMSLETAEKENMQRNSDQREEVEFKFVEKGAIRKKEDRQKLEGFACKECHEYFVGSGLTGEQQKMLMNKCSKHRGARHEFEMEMEDEQKEMWDLDMNKTAECDVTQPGSPLKGRRGRRIARKKTEVHK